MPQKKPCVLIILDGLGLAPACDSNAVSLAKKINLDKYITNYPVFSLLSSGEAVGLNWGEIGNSEVGHLNLGAGKIIYQNLPKINKAIKDETFFENDKFLSAINHVKENKSTLHIIGLMSDGKVHSNIDHVSALLKMAKHNKVKEVGLHCFLDGRDTLYNSAADYINTLQKMIHEIGIGQICNLSGRFYAMDRDNHWERIQKTYLAMTQGVCEQSFNDPLNAIEQSYQNNVYDEEFMPVVIGKANDVTSKIKDNDAVIFINYRADRARQLTHAFVSDDFNKFERKKIQNLYFVTMTEYEKGLPVHVAFEKDELNTGLSKIVSDAGLNQYHIAETEKYAHVTFFFNGGREDAFRGEDRDVIPSPRVASYADKPEMSAFQVTQKLIKVIMQEKHDFFVINYANPDMVGHTGDINAAIKAIEATDRNVGEIVDLILSKGGTCIITADHGNAEEMRNLQTGEISKDHSTNPVPCIIIGDEFQGRTNPESQLIGNDLSLLKPVGLLADVPVTVLKLLELEKPQSLTGRQLI